MSDLQKDIESLRGRIEALDRTLYKGVVIVVVTATVFAGAFGFTLYQIPKRIQEQIDKQIEAEATERFTKAASEAASAAQRHAGEAKEASQELDKQFQSVLSSARGALSAIEADQRKATGATEEAYRLAVISGLTSRDRVNRYLLVNETNEIVESLLKDRQERLRVGKE